MSEPVTSLAARPVLRPALPPMQVVIVGKIEAVRRYDGNSYSRVICPAPDLYSKPAIVEIRSPKSIGVRGDEIQVTSRLSGYARKPYSYTDKSTGEVQSITPVDMTLDLVD